VANIIDALRRIGRSTERSALKRQDDQLEGKEVLSRRRQRLKDPEGIEQFVATIEPVEEAVVPLSVDELRPIMENAALSSAFLTTFMESSGSVLDPENLDAAFQSWLEADDRFGYTNEAVTEILGAAFGQYCADRLNMRWVRFIDKDGEVLGLQGIERDFRGFPYHSISKRITDSEYGFFVPVFVSLRNAFDDARCHGAA
jgi:hypothetical protein